MILGVDGGNHETKVAGPLGVIKFPSDIGEYRDLKLKQNHGPDDMIWEYKGKRGFAGTLAKYESEFVGSMMGGTKAHEDTLIRVLLALHRYGGDDRFRIVVGQPIDTHTEDEKEKIIRMLVGKHTITVNGEKKELCIESVKVAAEGGASFWSRPIDGLVHQLDVGSGTVNWATLLNKRYIDKDSFTLQFGANSTKTFDLGAMARAIATKAAKYKDDRVRLVGGLAEELHPYIIAYFPLAEVQRPVLEVKGEILRLHSVYANAVGNYVIARTIYG